MANIPSANRILDAPDRRWVLSLIVGGLAFVFSLFPGKIVVSQSLPPVVQFSFIAALVSGLFALVISVHATQTTGRAGVGLWRTAMILAVSAFALLTMAMFFKASDGNEKPAFRLIRSEMTLFIDGVGGGTIERTRILEPTKTIKEMNETDFYGEGGLRGDNFEYPPLSIVNMDSPVFALIADSVICRVSYTSTPQYLTLRFTPPLESGRQYQQKTTIDVSGSYSDPSNDWLVCVCKNPTDLLEIAVILPDSLEFDLTTGRVLMTSQPMDEAAVDQLALPTEIQRAPNSLKWRVLAAVPQSKYIAEWFYVPGKGPKPPDTLDRE